MSLPYRYNEPRCLIVHNYTVNLRKLVESGMYTEQEALKERAAMFKLTTKRRKKAKC